MTGITRIDAASADPVRLFYWDKKKNFGDLIGPWLVEIMTGRPTINIRGRHDGPGLAAVGSIIGMFDRPGLEVWGAGLMASLDDETVARLADKKPARIHAVRGWRTYKELTSRLRWAVPKVYGDPALLVPRFYQPRSVGREAKVSLCPHFGHKSFFKNIVHDSIRVIDVQRDPETVIDEIAASSVCVSTSLHGLIVAQAYGVPWVWLEIDKHKVGKTNFKFEDFFTVLDRGAVQHVRLEPEQINEESMLALSRKGCLPRSKFTFDGLLDAFPVASPSPVAQAHAPERLRSRRIGWREQGDSDQSRS